MSAFGTRLLAYDPYISPARAAQIGVRLVPLEELLRESDFISIHLPKTPETVGPDRRASSSRCASRRCGSSTRRAAGWSTRPRWPRRWRPGRSPAPGSTCSRPSRRRAPRCSPSTRSSSRRTWARRRSRRRTRRASRWPARCGSRSTGEFVPDAVNVQAGGAVAEELRPALPLVEKLGRVFTALAGEVAQRLEVQVCGEIADARRLGAAAGRAQGRVQRRGRGAGHLRQRAGAGRGARARGVADHDPESGDYRNEIRLDGVLAGGRTVSVAGTLTGTRQVEKLTGVDGFDVEVALRRAPAGLPLRRRPRHRRPDRRRARRGRHQHRRRAGQPHPAGRRRPHGARGRQRGARRPAGRPSPPRSAPATPRGAWTSREHLRVVRRDPAGVHRGGQRAAAALPARRAGAGGGLPRGPRRAVRGAHPGAARRPRHRPLGGARRPGVAALRPAGRWTSRRCASTSGRDRADVLAPLRRLPGRAGLGRRRTRTGSAGWCSSPRPTGCRAATAATSPGIRPARAGEPWYADAADAQEALADAPPAQAQALVRATRPFFYGRWDERTQAHAATADRQSSRRAELGFAAGAERGRRWRRCGRRSARSTAPVLVVGGERDALTGVGVGRTAWPRRSPPRPRSSCRARATSRGWTSRRRSGRPSSRSSPTPRRVCRRDAAAPASVPRRGPLLGRLPVAGLAAGRTPATPGES